jgi:hypothetical protein
MYSVYVKTHLKSGVRYLGFTKHNPFTYPGSGKEWKKLLRHYPSEVKTEVIAVSENKKTINELGRYYSKLWNIVTGCDDYGNKLWANMIPETGGGGVNGNDHYTRKKDYVCLSKKEISQYQTKLLETGHHVFQQPGHYDSVRSAMLGKNNVNYNPKLFRWVNNLTGEEIYCTMNELCKKYNLDIRNVWPVATGNRKTHKGWTIE